VWILQHERRTARTAFDAFMARVAAVFVAALALATAKLNTKVEPQSVELTGRVDIEAQHDLAVRIAKSYSGYKQVVDKIGVQQ